MASLLAERGYEGVTFEEVAPRAGASKATLYRRWKSKRDVIVAVLKAGPSVRRKGAADIGTGSLRGEPLALCRWLVTMMRSAHGRTALLLLQAGLEDLEPCEEIERAAGPPGARLPTSVLDAAIRRAELPAGIFSGRPIPQATQDQ